MIWSNRRSAIDQLGAAIGAVFIALSPYGIATLEHRWLQLTELLS